MPPGAGGGGANSFQAMYPTPTPAQGGRKGPRFSPALPRAPAAFLRGRRVWDRPAVCPSVPGWVPTSLFRASGPGGRRERERDGSHESGVSAEPQGARCSVLARPGWVCRVLRCHPSRGSPPRLSALSWGAQGGGQGRKQWPYSGRSAPCLLPPGQPHLWPLYILGYMALNPLRTGFCG